MIPPGDSPNQDGREDLLQEAERLLLADREKESGEAGPVRAFLVFSLGREWYAIDLSSVRKVLRPASFARVPGALPEVLGLMNSQGEVLCILDLRKILGRPAPSSPSAEGQLVIVVQAGGKEAGVLVDTVDDVWEMPASDVAPTLDSLDPGKAKLFEGTLERDGRFVGLISAAMCLNP
ncbi:MAG TPA: chemotaxis protein CheW [Candidatus Deferrimicrobiaceae bacterium]|jgi:purine-binding chemotaxis protein CheW